MEEKKLYQQLEAFVYYLASPQWPLEIPRAEAISQVANLLNLDPADPEFISKAFQAIREILKKIEDGEFPPSVPPHLKELVAAYEKHLAAKEAQIKADPSYWEYYRAIFEEISKKIKNPYLAKAVSQQVTERAAETLPQVAHPQAFEETVKQEGYQAALQAAIQESLPSEIQLSPGSISRLAQTTRPLAAELAATPRPIPTSPPPPPISEKIPPSVIAKLTSEPQGVAFKPIFTLLHPPTAVSAVKKIVFTPIVKPLQWMVKIAPENVPEEIKKAVLEGLTSKDIQESISTLQEAGLSSNHPKIGQLENQQEALKRFETSHRVLSFIFRHYHEFSKKIGSRQIQEPKTGLWLPRLSPSPAWYQQKGYGWSLREGLNRLGIFLRIHQWIPTPSGRIISFVLPDKIVRLLTFGKIQSFPALKSAAYQKLVQPILVWLGKTALGDAIKTGAKKLASWALTKLGISLAAGGAAVAAGPPGWVVALVSFLPNILSLAKRGVKRLLEKPEALIAGGAALFALPLILPISPIIALFFRVVGAGSAILGILSQKTILIKLTDGANNFLRSTGDFVTNFSYATSSAPTLPSWIFILIFPLIAALSFFVAISQQGAFVYSTMIPGQKTPLQVVKTAKPIFPVGANQKIEYEITIVSGEENLTQVRVEDEIDLNYLESFSIGNGGVLDGNKITWPEFSLNGRGSSIVFAYSAKTKSGVNEKTKIKNLVTVSAKNAKGEIVVQKSSVTLNSDGAEIVQRAREIVASLSRGFWDFYNRSSLYPELFDEELFKQNPRPCVYKENYPPGCKGDPNQSINLFWCSWLVIKSYNETGHYVPVYISSLSLAEWFRSQGKFLPADTDISQIQPGDVLFLTVPHISQEVPHHVAIIEEVTPDYITTLDADSSTTTHTYTVSNGRVQNLPGLNIYGFGKP